MPIKVKTITTTPMMMLTEVSAFSAMTSERRREALFCVSQGTNRIKKNMLKPLYCLLSEGLRRNSGAPNSALWAIYPAFSMN
jgi:hypothetical protein